MCNFRNFILNRKKNLEREEWRGNELVRLLYQISNSSENIPSFAREEHPAIEKMLGRTCESMTFPSSFICPTRESITCTKDAECIWKAMDTYKIALTNSFWFIKTHTAALKWWRQSWEIAHVVITSLQSRTYRNIYGKLNNGANELWLKNLPRKFTNLDNTGCI